MRAATRDPVGFWTSVPARASTPVVEHLMAGRAAAELPYLPDHGVRGNGHGLIYAMHSDEALRPVLAWLDRHAGRTGARNGGER